MWSVLVKPHQLLSLQLTPQTEFRIWIKIKMQMVLSEIKADWAISQVDGLFIGHKKCYRATASTSVSHTFSENVFSKVITSASEPFFSNRMASLDSILVCAKTVPWI